MPRTIAIGDIHGCSAALAKLIELIELQPDDVLVPLGDFVDRGIDSKGVIHQLISLGDRCRLVPILGNHEEMMLGERTMDGMIEYVQHVLDTALSPDHSRADVGPGAMLVGWETDSEPMVVAVIAATMDTAGQRDSVEEDEAKTPFPPAESRP